MGPPHRAATPREVALLGSADAHYPDVVPPTVQVTTRSPGASARTVELPIEQQVNGVEGVVLHAVLQKIPKDAFAGVRPWN